MGNVVIQLKLLMYLVVLCLMSGCNDYNFSQLDLFPETNIKKGLIALGWTALLIVALFYADKKDQ